MGSAAAAIPTVTLPPVTARFPGPRLPEALFRFARTNNAAEFLLEMRRKYGDAFAIRGPDRLYVVLSREDHFDEILIRAKDRYTKDYSLAPLELLCNPKVLYPNATERARLQRIFRRRLTRRSLSGNDERIQRLARQACGSIPSRFLRGDGVQLMRVMLDLHFRAWISALLGTDPTRDLGELPDELFWLAEYLPHAWFTRPFPSPWRNKSDRLIRAVRGYLHHLVRTQAPDADAAMDCHALRKELSDDEIVDHVAILLMTSAAVPAQLATALHCIVRDPQRVNALCAVESPDEKQTREHQLSLLLSESFRMYPAASIILRDATDDHVVEGCSIPKGSVVLLPTYVLNRDPGRWSEPDVFRPERFDTDEALPDCFPFGRGPRFCMGASYSQIFMPAVLDQFTRNFSIELLERDERYSLSLPLSFRSSKVRLSPRPAMALSRE
ncbi:MAG: cytochrome P450 [Myxococcota bacterium]